MRIGIVGAGAAGLASAKHAISNGFECEIFEMAPQLGGTWVYTDDIDKDKYGYPVYSAMYKGLRTNLPKEVMGFPDFPVPDGERSYLSQEEVLKFLNMYANQFDLRPLIRFNHHVTNIKPTANGKWILSAINKPLKEKICGLYDVVMICNGHYNDPVYPNLPNESAFEGAKLHCNNFKSADRFAGKKVLLIGAGPSGLDLTLQISKVAEKVALSHHLKDPIKTPYPANVQLMPDVKRVLGGGEIEFVNGAVQSFDTILYCTGYKYSFPFLDKSCGVTVTDNHIEPLYKHMIHIEKPSLCFIGIPFNVCAFQMFDLQARYYMNFISDKMTRPSTQEMHEDTEREMNSRWAKGYSKRQAHLMGPDQLNYYNDLAHAADTTPIASVIVKLRDESVKQLFDDLINFRENRYKVIDDNTFIRL